MTGSYITIENGDKKIPMLAWLEPEASAESGNCFYVRKSLASTA